MDKPVSISVKEWIIRNMSVKMMVSERIIEAVVNHQFSSAYEAMEKNDSIEFSGWGKLYFNRKKANYKMEKMRSQKGVFENILAMPDITERRRKSTEVKLANTNKNIEVLSSKLGI